MIKILFKILEIWKDRKYGKSEKEAENLINRSWEQKKRENVTVKKGENGDKAETHTWEGRFLAKYLACLAILTCLAILGGT